MIGQLPSSRSIRFEVNLDGQMEFDMNGFLERKCANHLDEVLATLEANFNIATGPVQHNWKTQTRFPKVAKVSSGGNTHNGWWTIMNDMEWIRTIERESGFRRC